VIDAPGLPEVGVGTLGGPDRVGVRREPRAPAHTRKSAWKLPERRGVARRTPIATLSRCN
jgi:hypothetical protein